MFFIDIKFFIFLILVAFTFDDLLSNMKVINGIKNFQTILKGM